MSKAVEVSFRVLILLGLVGVFIFFALVRNVDIYVGRWQQVDGRLRLDIGKNKNGYSTIIMLDTPMCYAVVEKLVNDTLPVCFTPLQQQPVKMVYNESSGLLEGYWLAENKMLKLKKLKDDTPFWNLFTGSK